MRVYNPSLVDTSLHALGCKLAVWPAVLCMPGCPSNLLLFSSVITRPPEPVYSTVNKFCDKPPSPRHYSPVECDKSFLLSAPYPHYHLGLLPDSEIIRYCMCFFLTSSYENAWARLKCIRLHLPPPQEGSLCRKKHNLVLTSLPPHWLKRKGPALYLFIFIVFRRCFQPLSQRAL